MRPKYWTVKGGVVGTAHLNRDGVEVDFRPGTLLHKAYGSEFVFAPAKGVEGVEVLSFDSLTLVASTPGGRQMEEREYVALCLGQEVRFRWRCYVPDPVLEATRREAEMKVEADRRAVLPLIQALTPEQVMDARNPGHRINFRQLEEGRGREYVRECMARAVNTTRSEHVPVLEVERIVSLLLQWRQTRRAQKREEYLARTDRVGRK